MEMEMEMEQIFGHEKWSIIIRGTSTGAILAISIPILKASMDQCEETYTKLGHKNCVSDQLIDAASLGTSKVMVVSTLASILPASPFLFRNYELPMESEQRAKKIQACSGSSKHLVWQAIRASSAAPYYLDDFLCGEDRFQDGAACANNPTLIAIQQARLLWPDAPLECVVSMGSGITPPKPRPASMSSYMDKGSVLIENATSTERVHEAVATLLQIVPGVKYYRFHPEDERCGMELDDVDPANWVKLQTAADEYSVAHAARFEECAAVLNRDLNQPTAEERDDIESAGGTLSPRTKTSLRLGFRRGLLLLESPRCTAPPSAVTITERLADLAAYAAGLALEQAVLPPIPIDTSPAHSSFTHDGTVQVLLVLLPNTRQPMLLD
eukprot:gene3408-13451_t